VAKQSKNFKFITASAAAAMTATAVIPTAAFADSDQIFPDVPEDHNYFFNIHNLAYSGVVSGYSDGTFRMGQSVTRAEAAVMLASILQLDYNAPSTPFTDVKSNAWYTDAINALYEADIISGVDANTFGPNQSMTRAEFAQILYSAYDFPASNVTLPFTDVESGAWYEDAIQAVYDAGLIVGQSPTFYGTDNDIKRGDFAWLLANTDYALGDGLTKPAEFFDTQPPAIYYEGDTSLYVGYGMDAEIPDLSAYDDEDGEVPVTAVIENEDGDIVDEIDTSEAETYTVTYSAEDESGNAAEDVVLTIEVGPVDVEAAEATTKSLIDEPADEQNLSFTVNGSETSLSALEDAGYKVSFQTDEAVLQNEDGEAVSENSNGLLVSDLSAGDTFTYQVVITLDGNVAAQSEEQEVEVRESASWDEVEESVLQNENETYVSTIDVDQRVHLLPEEVTLNNGEEISPAEGENSFADWDNQVAAVSSSNEDVASVETDGNDVEITGESAGTADITVALNDGSEYITEVTIIEEDRVADDATAEDVSFTDYDGETTVTVEVTDQFGDPFIDQEVYLLSPEDENGNPVFDIESEDRLTDKNGEETFTISSNQASADDTYELLISTSTDSDDAIGEVSVDYTEVTDGISDYALRIADDSESTDENIDGYDESDNTIALEFVALDSAGNVIGTAAAGDTANDNSIGFEDAEEFSVEIDGEAVSHEIYNNGMINLAGVAGESGEAVITISEESNPVADFTVQVSDSTPQPATIELAQDAGVEVSSANDTLGVTADDLSQLIELDGEENFGLAYASTENGRAEFAVTDENGNETGAVVRVTSAYPEGLEVTDGTNAMYLQISGSLQAEDETSLQVQLRDNDGDVVGSIYLPVTITE